jgi:surface protein
MATLIASAKLTNAFRFRVVDKNVSAAINSTSTFTATVFRTRRIVTDLESSSTLANTMRYSTKGGKGEFAVSSSLVCEFPTYIEIDIESLMLQGLPEGTDCVLNFQEGWMLEDRGRRLPSGAYEYGSNTQDAPAPEFPSFVAFRTPKFFRSAFNAVFSIPTRTVLRIKQLQSAVASASTFSAVAIFNPGKFAALFAGVSQAVTVARKTVRGASALSSIVTTVVNNTRLKFAQSAVSSQFTLPPIDFWYRRLGVSVMSSTATISAAVIRNIGPIVATLQQAVQLTADAKRTTGITKNLVATSTIVVNPFKQLGLLQNISAVSSLSVTAEVPMVLKYTIPANSGTIYLPIFYGNINCKVDWGDGSAIQTVTQRELTSGGFNLGIQHSYGPGNYTVKITGTVEKVGKPRYSALPNTNNQTDVGSNQYLTEITSFGDLGTTSFEQAFSNCTKLQKVARRIPSTVTDISWMFWFSTAGLQESVWNVDDCQYWNTVNITTMSGTFMRCREGFNAPIGNWNTSNVTDMSSMFMFASDDYSGFNQNLNSWNTGNVTNMSYMFRQCKYYNQPMNNWDVSNVSNFIGMFWGENPINAFNQDIGAWDVTGCTQRANMELMLYTGGSLSNLDLSQWCVPTIATEPANFATPGGLAFNKKPVWGTCP